MRNKKHREYIMMIKDTPEFKAKQKIRNSRRWFKLKSNPIKYAKEKERNRLRTLKKLLKGRSANNA